MPYPKPKTWSFTLEELDAECADLEVVVKENSSLPASTMTLISRSQAAFSRIQREARKGDKGQPIAREDEWVLSAPQTMLSTAIMSWNLPYPDDYIDVKKRGQVIPLHEPELEPDPMGVLPGEVYQFILKTVMGHLMMPSKSA